MRVLNKTYSNLEELESSLDLCNFEKDNSFLKVFDNVDIASYKDKETVRKKVISYYGALKG